MASKESRDQKLTRVAREIGSALRRQARGRWQDVRTAERNERGHRVWRFRPEGVGGERFLHIEHTAMMAGTDAARRLMKQLDAEHWLDRLHQGPETALLLSSDGQVSALPSR